MDNKRTYRSDAEPGTVRITLSHGRSYGEHEGDRHTVRLAIEDAVSGVTLVRLRLDPDQFTALMGSSSITVEGATLPAHPERIGRRHEMDSRLLPRTATEDELAAAVNEYYDDGWPAVDTRKGRDNWTVTARRWLPVEDEAPAETA